MGKSTVLTLVAVFVIGMVTGAHFFQTKQKVPCYRNLYEASISMLLQEGYSGPHKNELILTEEFAYTDHTGLVHYLPSYCEADESGLFTTMWRK